MELDISADALKKQKGVPSSIKRGPVFEFWYYGEHCFYLNEKHVKGYDSASGLGVVLKPKRKSGVTYLTPESSQDEVISVLGTPRKISCGPLYEVWWYGGEFIQFLKGHIMEYSNGRALKFDFSKRKNIRRPTVAYQKGLDEFSTASEVVAIKGTPTQYRRGLQDDTWWFGEDVALVRGDALHYYYRPPKKPKDVSPNLIPKEDPVMNRLRYKGTGYEVRPDLIRELPIFEESNPDDFEDSGGS
jgi:hypothetical protein